jgi:type I restriction enzyme, S subunit
MNFSDSEMGIYQLSPGDVLLSEASGSPGEVGKPALWSGELDECAFQNTLIRIRPHDVDSLFLLHYFRYVALTGGFAGQARGVGIHHLGRARIARWLTPVPPPDEQRRIVDILEDHLSHLDAASYSLKSAARRLTALRVASLGTLWNRALEVVSITTPIGNAGSIVTGSTPSTRGQDPFGGGTPFLTPSDVAHGDLISSYQRSLNEIGAKGSRLVGPSAVVVVCIGATIGKVGWINQVAATNQQINTVDLDDSLVLPEFLAALVAAPQFQHQMFTQSSSTTMPILNKSKFSRLRVPVPEISSQRAILNDLSWCSNAGVRAAQASAVCDRRSIQLRRSLLGAAFSGRLTGRASDMETVEEMASV